jgi:methylated-DNA-[protein]-cysteine S-methyltransferase
MTGMLAHRDCDTPVGTLRLVADEAALLAILWPEDDPARVPLAATAARPDDPVLVETVRQLDGYFGGSLTRFDLPLRFVGTAFQQRVWQALLTIPFGETRSYGDIARQIGNLSAIRAVGAANGRNPISIVVPCHRVVGASGALTGFAGGLAVKRRLLDLEQPTLFGRAGDQAVTG